MPNSSRLGRFRKVFIEQLEDRRLMASLPIQISIENLSPIGGLAVTPLWVGVHNGNFELGREGRPASEFGGLEDLAEEGITAGIGNRFDATTQGVDATIGAPGGFAGAPVIEPGESAIQILTVNDTRSNRYLSYASMLIPSNDAFFANLNARQFEIFDRGGNFRGPITIDIFGSQIWDAGTEVNNPQGGAAFSTEGGSSVDENGTIRRLSNLNNFIGTGLPTGSTLQSAFRSETPLFRITVSRADRPSGPVDRAGPRATLEATDVLTTDATNHSIRIVYSDPSGINVSRIGTDDIRVVGRNGQQLNVVGVTTDAPSTGIARTVVATYTLSARDGFFDSLDNSRYTVEWVHDAIRDIAGNRNNYERLGEFRVDTGTRLQVTVENLSPDNGLLQTPFWVSLHDGRFEIGREGQSASRFSGLELIAEEGDTSELAARFDSSSIGIDATIIAPGGFAGAPVFEPSEIASQVLDVRSPGSNRYFSYASMIIPSNDAFVANLDARFLELFDRAGNFRGPRTIEIFNRNVWDSGTEVNNANGGAAFSALGGTSTTESRVIARHAGLSNFIGTPMANGNTLGSTGVSETPLARITISLARSPSQPIDNSRPTALLTASDLNASTPFHEIKVSFFDPSGIKVSRISSENLQVIGQNGRRLRVELVSTDAVAGTNPRTVTATYRLSPQRGSFGRADNTTYSVQLRHNAISDLAGNSNLFQSLGSFRVTA